MSSFCLWVLAGVSFYAFGPQGSLICIARSVPVGLTGELASGDLSIGGALALTSLFCLTIKGTKFNYIIVFFVLRDEGLRRPVFKIC